MYNKKQQGYGTQSQGYGSGTVSYSSKKSKCPRGAKLGAKMSMCGVACSGACMHSD